MKSVHTCTRAVRAAGLALALATLPAAQATAAERLPLSTALELGLRHHPSLDVSRAQRDEAHAARLSAQARPNPEIEILAGRSHARTQDTTTGNLQSLGLAQPLEWPGAREARIKAADAGIEGALAADERARQELIATLKQAYFDTLRRQVALRLATEDQQHLEQVRLRVQKMVDVGEAPRYEQVKAEAEMLAATRRLEGARFDYSSGLARLRTLIGPEAPVDPELELPETRLPETLPLPPLFEALRERHPALREAQSAMAAALARVEEARIERIPAPTLKASAEQAPDTREWRLGVSIPIPLFDTRRGPLAEAQARLTLSESQARQVALELTQALEQAHHRYLTSLAQFRVIEGGLRKEAEAALRVAEIAYRAGERGILDVLDAQRTLRAVREDQLHARYDIYAALIDLERLTGENLLGVTP
ncbi:MAG: TolC family protein [Halothiobacillaceae bacterium]|nr:TolC family protein [Halothiobacillaceae bacterium]